MFYHCAKFALELPGGTDPGVGGAIVAAAARSRMALVRKQRKLLREFPWLVHRLFDPQLYLSNLPATGKHAANLATYPWFGVQNPPFDSRQHKKVRDWMNEHNEELRAGWQNKTIDPTIAAETAIDFQLNFGAEAIIIPGPLTTIPADQFGPELEYIDAAIRYTRNRILQPPLYATVAITDSILRGTPPASNPLLRTISDQIAARQELEGAYIVIEQSADSGHCYNCEEGCLTLLLLTDELSRGAGKQVIINYGGSFGAVCMAAGAGIWASGHYRSQRRFKLADEEEDRGSSFPRYHSPRLIGDIGLENNVRTVYHSPLRRWLLVPETEASKPLLRALDSGKPVEEILDWAYTQGNVTEGAKHYHQICVLIDRFLAELPSPRRIRAVHHWLNQAASLGDQLSATAGIEKGSHTDTSHQKVWLNAFNKWRQHAKV